MSSKDKVILYVDPDPEVSQKAKEAFEQFGYACVSCTSGKDGLDEIETVKPDLVIVDSMLPDITGEELYTRILTKPKFKKLRKTPFIMLTHNGEVDRPRMYNLGFSALLAKPVDGKALVEFAEDVLVSHQVKMEEMNCWETIHEAKDFLERVVESSVDAIITTDNKGIITYCNHAGEDLLGLSFEEVVGHRISKFLTEGGTELLRISNILTKRNKLPNYKLQINDQKGRAFFVNVSISTMRNGQGNVMGALGVCKKLDTNGFTEYDGNESDRLATVVETAIAVNHAINNPLVPILGNAQFLLQDDRITSDDIRRRLRVIVKNALRIRDITQKLASITHPVSKEYLQGTKMLDIDAST